MKANWLIADQGELADFASVHRYDILNAAASDGFLHVRNLYRAAGECRIIGDIGGKPCFTEETGNWRNIALSLEGMGHTLRCLLWNAWAENCRAFLWWCAFDQDHLDTAPYDWRQVYQEFGLMTSGRRNYAYADTVRDFAKFQDGLPFEALPPVKRDAVFIVSDVEVAHASYVLARQAGIYPRFASPDEKLPEADFFRRQFS